MTGGLHIPFYFERELRARHPRGVLARLRPYESYYWSPEHKDDQPPFPVTLFVVDTEEVEDTYVSTTARISRMSLPILASCTPVLSSTGILGESWRRSGARAGGESDAARGGPGSGTEVRRPKRGRSRRMSPRPRLWVCVCSTGGEGVSQEARIRVMGVQVRWVTKAEAARELDMSLPTLDRMIRRGRSRFAERDAGSTCEWGA